MTNNGVIRYRHRVTYFGFMTNNRFLDHAARFKKYSFSIVAPDMIMEFAILQFSPILQFLPIIDLKTETFFYSLAFSETKESIIEELLAKNSPLFSLSMKC